MNFCNFCQNRPLFFRGHNYSVDERTMTVPDAVPTLKEIILSGSAQRVGVPEYDSSFEEGAMRWRIQNAPLDVVLNAVEEGAKDNKRSEADAKPTENKDKDNAAGEPLANPAEAQ